MQTLNQDIKNNDFKKVYLLFGEEAFLKKSYKKPPFGKPLPRAIP